MASRGRIRQETALLSHRAAWVVHHSTSPAAQEGRTAFLAGYSATELFQRDIGGTLANFYLMTKFSDFLLSHSQSPSPLACSLNIQAHW